MLEVAILITVFNRRERTLACLENCYRQFDMMKADSKYSFTIYLVDDGSTDGTSESIRELYPDVCLIAGDGSLFWNQGMRLAWKEASKKDYDFYLWLNDDTVMEEGALAVIMENSQFLRHRAIVVGTAVNSEGKLSYGGRTRGNNKVVEPDPVLPLPCYTFNGNLVLVPRSVYKILGNLEESYRHGFGDYDYGVRAQKAGIPRVVAPGISAVCDRNPGIPGWRDPSFSLKERYRFLLGPKGRPPREQFLYDFRSMGFFGAIGHMVSLNLKVIFPVRSLSSKLSRRHTSGKSQK